jgi:hypothetical protein
MWGKKRSHFEVLWTKLERFEAVSLTWAADQQGHVLY